MNAIPKPAADLLQQTGQLSESVTRPIPGSRKIFVEGSRPDLRVAMREIAQTQTPTLFGGETNPPITVYDPSGPYTDPDARIDLAVGLPALRAKWIEERGDTELLPQLSSAFGRGREHDPKLAGVRFPTRTLPRVAKTAPTGPLPTCKSGMPTARTQPGSWAVFANWATPSPSIQTSGLAITRA